MSTSLRLSFAKMRENFRWADLVSGNLKEEQGRSLHLTVAFEWPLCGNRATCCFDTSQSRSGTPESGFRSCTFDGSKHKWHPSTMENIVRSVLRHARFTTICSAP